MSQKKIVILAGPNGAGKTTFAQEFLPNEAKCFRFINADLIAKGLSPFNPEMAALRAGRVMVEEIASCIRLKESFAFETTLSGLRYARLIPQWQKKGFFVKLVFLRLSDPAVAIVRVASRVSHGGHDVPEDVIRRRYIAGLNNFHRIYTGLVNAWVLYDNSQASPRMLEKGYNRR